ncbi:MAG: BON domain-containing protein [Pyrinomonadaceae bacterium]
MASRYEDRDHSRGRDRRGNGGERNIDRYRASFERGFGGSDRGDLSEYGREENYFGSGRQQYGGGYSGTGRTGRDNAEWTGEYGSGGGSTSERRGRGYGDRERRGAAGSRGGYESMSGYDRGDYDREDYGSETGGGTYSGPAGGMFGGGFGGYTGGGYQGYERDERGTRGQGGWSGYGGGNYGRGSYDRSEYERGYGTRGGSSYERDDRRDDERGFFERLGDEVSSWFGGEDESYRDRDRYSQRQSFRGRGPRNYSRSDERIKEDINDRLTDSHLIDASDIDVEVSGGDVVLTGTVESRYAKRMAEDIAEEVSGVKNVENRIRVNRDQSSSGYSGSSSYAGGMTGASATGTSTTGSSAASGGDKMSGTGATSDLGVAGTSSAVDTGNTGSMNAVPSSTTGTSGTKGTSSTGRGRGRSAGS